MIEFRQKYFGVGEILGAATSLLGGGEPQTRFGKTMAGAQFVSGEMNNRRQARAQEEQTRSAERIAKRQAEEETKRAQIQAKAQEKIAKQQAKVTAKAAKSGARVNVNASVGGGLQQQQEDDSAQQIAYSISQGNRNTSRVKEAGGFLRNLGTLAKERGLHKALAGAAVAGTVSGVGTYLVDRAIQKDIKKDGIIRLAKPELSEEEIEAKKKKKKRRLIATVGTGAALVGGTIAAKHGAFGAGAKNIADKYISKNTAKGIGNTLKDATKDYFTHEDPETGKRKVNALNLALTGVGVASPVLLYMKKKKKYKDQISQSEGADEESEKEKHYSKGGGRKFKINLDDILSRTASGGKKGGSKSYNGTLFDIPSMRRGFNSQLNNQTGKTKFSLSRAWKEFKKHPGESALGAASSFAGGGGRKGVSKFGEDLSSLGKKTNNRTSQKVGEFIKEHPKTSLAGSIVVGGVVIRGARNRAWNTANRVIEKVDPNAFAYQKYGAEPINGKNLEENKENNNLEEDKNNG